MFHTVEEALNWITKLMPAHGMKPGLERTQALLAKLGYPERRLKFIHVAGTNGKGSTCAFIASVLQEAGYDVGLFTSPYLEKYTGRILHNQQPIPDPVLLSLTNQIKPLVDELEPDYGALTMFEISTVIAIVYYATVSYPDYVVWETGLGGRLDATNVVTPILAIITNIGYDHMDILGNTLTEIAAEKAGIIKSGVPVISGATDSEATEVIRRIADGKKSTLYELNREFTYETIDCREEAQRFHFEGPFRKLTELRITMNGLHQQTNASLAMMAIEVLRQYYALIVDQDALYAGFARTRWSGRMEMIQRSPRILLDGAHNPQGAKALVEAIQQIYIYHKLILVLGMVHNKNHDEYLRHILPIVNTCIITQPDFFKSLPAAELSAIAETCCREFNLKPRIILQPDWKLAIAQAQQIAQSEDLIFITGSLYLISDARLWILNRMPSEKGW
jgi:dihydrofolate synthase/folylpolyglutamate synthase